MTSIVGVPFSGGFVVGADSASAFAPGEAAPMVSKLSYAGGVLFSISGIVSVVAQPAGRVVWSLADVICGASPAKLREADIARIARAAAKSLEAHAGSTRSDFSAADTGSMALFWWPARVVGFVFRVEGARVSTASNLSYSVDPSARLVPLVHGVDADKHVIGAGLLKPSSYALMSRRIGDTTEAQARKLVLDIQAAAARAMPSQVGGAVDLRVVRTQGATCPCGSGRAFTACHGGAEQRAP